MDAMEYDEEVNCPCPCGQGRVLVVRASPNQMFATAYFPTQEVLCEQCKGRYEIQRQSHRWILCDAKLEAEVAAEIALATEPINRKLRTVVGELHEQHIAPLRAELEERIRAGGRTKAHWFNAAAQLFPEAIDGLQTFKRQIRRSGSLSSWVASQVTEESLRAVMKKLGRVDSAAFESLVASRRALDGEARRIREQQARVTFQILPEV